MEAITNIASTATNIASTAATTATTTVSNLIYGGQKKNNETEGKEPVSGEQGKGTVTDPFDHGNAPTPLETTDKKSFIEDSSQPTSREPASAKATESSSESTDFLKLAPVIDGPKNEEGAPKIHTNAEDTTYTGMPIVPLNPDVATSGVNTKSSPATESTVVTDKAGTTGNVLKETPLDDINHSGAPDAAAKTAAPDSVTASSETYQNPTIDTKALVTPKKSIVSDGDVSPKTDAPLPVVTAETKGIVSEKPSHKPEPRKSSPTSEEKSSKMSHIKEKLKDKLHIGSKDK